MKQSLHHVHSTIWWWHRSVARCWWICPRPGVWSRTKKLRPYLRAPNQTSVRGIKCFTKVQGGVPRIIAEKWFHLEETLNYPTIDSPQSRCFCCICAGLVVLFLRNTKKTRRVRLSKMTTSKKKAANSNWNTLVLKCAALRDHALLIIALDPWIQRSKRQRKGRNHCVLKNSNNCCKSVPTAKARLDRFQSLNQHKLGLWCPKWCYLLMCLK